MVFGLPGPKALLDDWLAMRGSMRARHLPLRLPAQPPEVESFWAALQVNDGPLPDLNAGLELVEKDATGTVYRFAFPSRVVSADTMNNIVHGRYYLPVGKESMRGAPFLLLLHVNSCQDGWFEAGQARRLMRQGCCVAQMVLPYHMQRLPERLESGAAVMTPDLPHTLAAVSQAVCDAADLLRWARAQGAGRVMLAGWSLGGLVSALVATQLPLDAALLVEPAASLPWMMARYGLYPARLRRQLRAAGLSQGELERWLAPIMPANLKPSTAPERIRILAARYDGLVGYEPVLALWRAWGQPALKMEPTGHVGLLFGPALPRELDQMAAGR